MPAASDTAAELADSDDSDSEDEDFVPQEEGADQQGARAAPGGASRRSSKRKPAFMEVSDEEDDAAEDGGGGQEEEEEADEGEEGEVVGDAEEGSDEEIFNPRKAARTAKIESIWSALKAGGSTGAGAGSTNTAVPKYCCGGKLSSGFVAGSTLASLCQPVRDHRPAQDPDKHWMKALGMDSTHSKPSQIDRSAALAALEAAKTATSVAAASRAGKVVVTEKRSFAGKEVEVTTEVSRSEAAGKPKSSGLDQLLASLQGSKKISVLDKSRNDWKTFKGSNTEVEEELETHKKSSNKYLDKQEFLKQAELKQYEKERDQRLAADVRTRGRL
mmetsp:Transcript_26813/g.75507  ORF Transcript_26813/g.75507 Transcript_26813/m.75507 type:complete len:330 (-) Transcript_26813:258-1247(-)|eukprot:CAMPEP_0117665908 /NCGR_PEP_ID=MMETSP0804-20121206/10075_1 /TAXON_ID=1074897 /ORGANISM="Tetraselmis astigmatica, Strain CCMP880" /LENGTH=329 /DNA_ID=CAMNT_0005473381 /DNA_START=57 /DNA_END=1046 /DNA_ORIENTATION=+